MRVNRNWVYGTILVVVLVVNLFLTLQSSLDTNRLSEGLRQWLQRFGFHSDPHTFRSNAHLAAFFIIGVAMALFGRECGWKWMVILVVGFVLGLFDEGIKVLLPTRHFESMDLFKDLIGITAGTASVYLIKHRYKVKRME